MKLGIIGLGRMGAAISYRVLQAGHQIVGFDPDEKARQEVQKMGATVVDSPSAVAQQTNVIWLMVPAGELIDTIIQEIIPATQDNTIIVDGGNSHYPDSVKRYNYLKQQAISFIDCGVSGGLRGKEIGFSLMVGGDKAAYETIEPLLQALAAPDGYGYMGPAGVGHYVKMVHNGIEYALLQAYAQGCHLLRQGEYPDLDLAKVTNVWSHGSVIRSWIVDLLHDIFEHDQQLDTISGRIDENLTGRWTSSEAKQKNIPVELIDDALAIRAWSRKTGGNYATKVVALLRNKFGGHAVRKIDEK